MCINSQDAFIESFQTKLFDPQCCKCWTVYQAVIRSLLSPLNHFKMCRCNSFITLAVISSKKNIGALQGIPAIMYVLLQH